MADNGKDDFFNRLFDVDDGVVGLLVIIVVCVLALYLLFG